MNHVLNRPMTRRRFLIRAAEVGLAVGAVGLGAGAILERIPRSPWNPKLFPPPGGASVAVLEATTYNGDLEGAVMDGVGLIGLDVRGASVLLKPNLVEWDPAGAINTDPRLVAATVAVMKRMGARSVTVAEGSGNRRDTQFLVTRSGLGELLREVNTPFVDLNTAALTRVPLQTGWTALGELWLPTELLDADVVISMPKMKTHHWGGVTLSLKNMFGAVPGRIYGWPKNVLHWAGLSDAILDVAAAARPNAAIVDGIVGMQGDGPIMGNPIPAGHLVFGTDPVAVDVTAAALMGVDPQRVGYLTDAARFLGQGNPERITQLGEDPGRLVTPFVMAQGFAGLASGAGAGSKPSLPANAVGG